MNALQLIAADSAEARAARHSPSPAKAQPETAAPAGVDDPAMAFEACESAQTDPFLARLLS